MANAVTTQQLANKLELLDQVQRRRVYELVNYLLSRTRPADSGPRKQLLLESPVWTDEDVSRIREVQQDINAWRIPT